MIDVSRNQLLRYTLARQGLLERKSDAAILTLGVLHATDHTTPYLSLLARVDDFSWELLADRIYDDRAYLRLRCMRGTIHLVPAAHVDTIRCIYNWREEDPFPDFAEYGMSMDEALEARFYVTEALRQHGAQSSASIKKLLQPGIIRKYKNRSGGETTNIALMMRWLWELGLLESGAGISSWRTKDNHFRMADFPPLNCDDEKRRAAEIDLARWYFDLYAPASFEDWTWWSGFSKERSRPAFDALELAEVHVAGMRETLWMIPENTEALTQTPDEPPQMVRLLPYEDALLKAYKETRYRFYDEAELAGDVAFTRNGEAVPTMWVDGRIMGIWEWMRKANEPMTLEPFEQMTKALRKRLKPEIDRVQAFVEASHVLWTS